jgi:hypothetical protein
MEAVWQNWQTLFYNMAWTYVCIRLRRSFLYFFYSYWTILTYSLAYNQGSESYIQKWLQLHGTYSITQIMLG